MRPSCRSAHKLQRHHAPTVSLFQWSQYQYQIQAENARKLLIRKDGRQMSQHEIESLFKNIGTILEDVAKDPKGYQPSELEETEELMSNLRQIQLEYAPPQLQYLSSNFMIWFHGLKGKRVYKELHHISTQYDHRSGRKENAFSVFSDKLLKWSSMQSDDMQTVWALLDGIDVDLLRREMEMEDDEEMTKMVRSLRLNASLYLDDYHRFLMRSYDDIMTFSQSITFLEFDEAQLALTAAPFLGKFDVLYSLMDRLTAEKERECRKSPEILVEKVVDLPTGLNWFHLYKMYDAGSRWKVWNNRVVANGGLVKW